MLSLVMIAVMQIYHYILTLIRPRPKFIFFDFLKEGFPSIIKGFCLGMIPMFIIEILNEIIMTGYIFTKSIQFNKDCVDDDTTDDCIHTLFDYIKLRWV